LWLNLGRLWHRLLVVLLLLLLLLLMCVLRHLLWMHGLRRRTWLYGLLVVLERSYRLLLRHSLLRLRWQILRLSGSRMHRLLLLGRLLLLLLLLLSLCHLCLLHSLRLHTYIVSKLLQALL
jgi:hypothetical protein